jgi:hypothetical protein
MDDPRELEKAGNLNKLQDYFNEPWRKTWTVEDLKNLEKVYEFALQLDQADPVDAVIAFDRTYPHNIEVGTEKSRLGKILLLLEIHLKNTAGKYKGFKGVKREF